MPMPTALDPIISEFTNEEEAASYDLWFRASVREAMENGKPRIPPDQLMAKVETRLLAKQA